MAINGIVGKAFDGEAVNVRITAVEGSGDLSDRLRVQVVVFPDAPAGLRVEPVPVNVDVLTELNGGERQQLGNALLALYNAALAKAGLD